MTTKPSLFWVDPGEFSGLLERAGAAEVRSTPVLPRSDYTSSAAALPVAEAPAVLPRDPAVFEPPRGSLDARLSALLVWIRSVVAFNHAFVVDEEGLALVHESAPLELIAASSTLAETWDSLRNRFSLSTDNLFSVHLMEGQHLHLMTLQTHWGRLSLGVVLDTPLPKSRIATISEQFRRTLAEKEHLRP